MSIFSFYCIVLPLLYKDTQLTKTIKHKEELTMKKLMKSILFAATTLCAAIMLFSSTARAETTQCTPITTIPMTITTQGIYCLTGNLAGNLASVTAITIITNNVTIDMNGYKLGNLAAGAGTGSDGIDAQDRKNITIRNGTIRGFHTGIWLAGPLSSGHLVENMRMDGNTYRGIRVDGKGATVRNNQVVTSGGTTVPTFVDAQGILVRNGYGARIINNSVADTVEQTGAISYGIRCSYCSGTLIENNHISNSTAGVGTSYGVYVDNSSNTLGIGNRITSNIDFAIFCINGVGGKLSNNRTAGVTTAYSGCQNTTNNF